jgi:multidrug efflux pump subunit AcrB
MNAFTDLFIRRPVLATVVSLLILLVGGMAAYRLQVRQFPETSNTTITITTTYPGAAADVIKGFITTPIEQAVASAEGIDTLVSTSQQNTSTITLNLRLEANPDRAMADTLSKVNRSGAFCHATPTIQSWSSRRARASRSCICRSTRR